MAFETYLVAVRARHEIARHAGEDLDAHTPAIVNDSRVRAIVQSWQDVSTLHDAAKRMAEALEKAARDCDLCFVCDHHTSRGHADGCIFRA